ncbi:MAG: cell division protein FtsZ [Defluviitaleaceae bacterium]|nr:cell division protein FtsZ [Defluviitaleaceae bacterium]
MIDIETTQELRARIKVIGVGGGGNNAVDRMIEAGVEHIDFISANTDNKALLKSKAPIRIQLGEKQTKGLGAGGRPEQGRKAAEESRETIKNAISNTELLFVTAGMGGGTGTGAAPVIASYAKEAGEDILTVAVVTKPFNFEGKPRMRYALEGIEELRKNVDTLIVIPNENLLQVIGDDVSIVEAFKQADEVLRQGVVGLSGVILGDGLINLDFADVKTIMKDGGIAHMGIGSGTGKNKIETALKAAINSPLLETSIQGAKSILISFAGDASMSLKEVGQASEYLREEVAPDAEIIFGTAIDENLKDEVVVTLIATGLQDPDGREVNFVSDPGREDRPFDQPRSRPSEFQLQEAREELEPIRNSNFRLVSEDVAAPAFLRDWRRGNNRDRNDK